MIVKNEAHIIADTLHHLWKYIQFDYWVISDTGSTDQTKEIIKAFFAEKGVPGELQEEPWRDFGYNRTKAFEGAYGKADYAFVWDADDEISGDFKMPADLTADSYKFVFGNAEGMRYSRGQLFSMKKRWCYKGVLHEYADCLEPAGPMLDVLGDYFFISGRRGDRSKDPNKYLNDALVLEKAAEKALAENDPLYNRYIFYCAQSYNSCNMKEKAIEFYKKGLTLPLWIQEKYVSCMEIYDKYEELGKPEEGLYYLVESYKYDTTRLECVYRLIKHYCIHGPAEVAYAYYTLVQDFYENHYDGSKLGEKLFAKKNEYDFFLPYYMVIVSERSKHLDTCAKMYEAVFKHQYAFAGEWWIRNLIHNMQFCINQLPDDMGFVNNFFTYMRFLKGRGVNLEPSQLTVIGKMINRYKGLLGSPAPSVKLANSSNPRVMLTMTSCKRWDLFEKTVNSLLHMWTDIDKVDYFFCVDDNSSQRDRSKMKATFPFIDFYMKRQAEKGHRTSMNVIYDKLNELKPTFWIHMEDDWLFFEKDTYVQKSIDFLDRNEGKDIHQILYNRNYAETYEGWTINGGEPIEGSPGFLLHVKSDSIPGQNCGYWPHYSFRPSMIRTSAVLQLGNYDSPNNFFERDYADKYYAKGYKSAFFDRVCCLHTGKLTSDKTGTNAYTLNKMGQFNGDASKKGSNFVVNLLRRTDRKEAMEIEFEKAGLNEQAYEFFEAVDGKELTLTDEINALFLGNDFGSRKGVIGCALSHYALWKQLVASDSEYYTIFEDDAKLGDGFKAKWEEACSKENLAGVDMSFLGYHVREVNKSEIYKDLDPTEGSRRLLDSNIYIGGFYAYIITKAGAKKMLDYISENGIKHGIDYLVKVVPGFVSYNCQPHIVFSDWVVSSESNVDTDIQKDYSSLQIQAKVDETEWVFHPGVDSGGSDIRCVGRKSVAEIMAEASADKRCIAFNTLGFLKSEIKVIERTPYINTPNSGIYIKKSYLCKESMSTRQVKKDNYTVNDLIGVARKCDLFVYHSGHVRVTNTADPRHIFVSSYRGGESLEYFMKIVLPLVKSKFNLIIAGDDFTFPNGTGDIRENLYADKQPLIQTLLENQYLGKIFVENLDTLHPKMSPIPLGLVQNGAQGYHSNLKITNEPVDFSKRPLQAFCIHRNRDGPQWELRAKVSTLCRTQWPFVTYKEGDTMNNGEIYGWMRKSQFCLCVRGGGYDPSPKAWEALINGCIPIIQRSPLDEVYSRFPVVFVDDWTPESLSQEKLEGWLKELRPFYENPEKRKEVLNMLTLDYWWNIIRLPDPWLATPNLWVAPYLCGGLGNRLFQVSAALGLAQKMGRELVFYKPMINNNTHHKVDELYLMFPEIRIIDENHDVHMIREAELENYSFKAISSENVQKHIVTRGYWQNYQYLPESGLNPVLKFQDLSKYGLDTDKARLNSWFIHVRLGDYKKNGCVNHITMDSYYKKILDQIPAATNLILFSDEPDVAANMLKGSLNESIELRICDEKNESVSLGLMSQCWGGAIVPNSTFSWWGAYFARRLAVEHGDEPPFKAFFPLRWGANIPSRIHNNCNPPWAIGIDNTIDASDAELWDFYEGVDSGGGDIRRANANGVDNMKVVAQTEMNCVAFNTLGFLKSRVKFPLIKSPWLHAPNGLYVKKGYKPITRIKMLCNWCSSEDLCKEWLKMCKGDSNTGTYKWNDLEITWSDDDIDYYVIINKPRAGDKYVAEKSIIYHMEPWCAGDQTWGVKTWGSWARPDPKNFLQVRIHDHFVNPVFWQISLTYDELQTMSMEAQKKPHLDKIVSSICSSKYFDPGHKKRIDFLKYLETKDFPLHIYNEDNQHGFKSYQGKARPSVDKEKGLVPYKYYFMCENNAERNFITEKLWEPILCESLCFYWGCPNVADIVDPMAYVQLDMNDFESAYNTMNAAIQMNLWEERLPYIKAAKQKILENSFFPTLEKVLMPKVVCFIHSCHLASVGTEKLDLILDAVLKVKEIQVITINNIGLRLDHAHYEAMDPRIIVVHSSDNPLEFELPTLRFMHEFSLNSPNTKILYVHTKGISYPKGDSRYEPGLDWINYMLHFLCEKSEQSLRLLDSHDVAGCNFSELPKPHFSGNFWWATAKYLKTLATNLLTDKMSAEWWLHSSNPVKATLWNSGKNHFQERYPKEYYNLIRYLSGGKLGDFIHQLSVIQEKYIETGKKAILYITNTGDNFALGLNRAYNDTKTLIMSQPYIYDFKIYNGEQYDINLSDWRNNKLTHHTNWHTLFKAQYKVEWGTHPWLHVSNTKPEFNDIILFNCVMLRFPEKIDFGKLFDQHGRENIRFITENMDEYIKFKDKTGLELQVYLANSVEDFVITINSCKMFIGTLSSPLTYAYALHKKNITLVNELPISVFVNGLENILPDMSIML
jgi:GR25 family glycosyltransferase involved in LPS biosynthesis